MEFATSLTEKQADGSPFVFSIEDIPEGGKDIDDDYIESHRYLNVFGIDFFKYERIQRDKIVEVVELLRTGIEDGKASDEDLQEIMTYNDFSVLKFLLNAILHNLGTVHVLVRCLAFGGNICETLWSDFAHQNTHLLLLVHSSEYLLSQAYQLAIFREKVMHRRSYHGFDKRDIKEFNMEGYEDEEIELEQRKQAKLDREERILTILLLLTQFYSHPIDLLNVFIENAREQNIFHNSSGSETVMSITDNTSDDVSESIIIQQIPKLASLLFDINHAVTEEALTQSMKLIVAFAQQYPPLKLSQVDDTSNSLGIYTEFSRIFVSTDQERADGGLLQQTLLYLLNENNYPQGVYEESMAALRLITTILYTNANNTNSVDRNSKDKYSADNGEDSSKSNNSGDHDKSGSSGNEDEGLGTDAETAAVFRDENTKNETPFASNKNVYNNDDNETRNTTKGNPGNFYVNDLKVLMDVCVRELANVVRHSGERKWDNLRARYVHVILGVLECTNWSKVADNETKDNVRLLLEDISQEEIYAEETRFMAEFTLQEFQSKLLVTT